jgi:DNA-binding NarL/FixJ family response regulator
MASRLPDPGRFALRVHAEDARFPNAIHYAIQRESHAGDWALPAAASSSLEHVAVATWHGDPAAVVRVLRGCAARAWASRDSGRAASFLAAADTVAQSSSTSSGQQLAGEMPGPGPSPRSELGSPDWQLTQREQEVLILLAQRRTDAEIAAALSISRRTASSHVGSIISKLRVSNRRDAAAIALRESMIEC